MALLALSIFFVIRWVRGSTCRSALPPSFPIFSQHMRYFSSTARDQLCKNWVKIRIFHENVSALMADYLKKKLFLYPVWIFVWHISKPSQAKRYEQSAGLLRNMNNSTAIWITCKPNLTMHRRNLISRNLNLATCKWCIVYFLQSFFCIAGEFRTCYAFQKLWIDNYWRKRHIRLPRNTQFSQANIENEEKSCTKSGWFLKIFPLWNYSFLVLFCIYAYVQIMKAL